jgi:hypothetical protein
MLGVLLESVRGLLKASFALPICRAYSKEQHGLTTPEHLEPARTDPPHQSLSVQASAGQFRHALCQYGQSSPSIRVEASGERGVIQPETLVHIKRILRTRLRGLVDATSKVPLVRAVLLFEDYWSEVGRELSVPVVLFSTKHCHPKRETSDCWAWERGSFEVKEVQGRQAAQLPSRLLSLQPN